VDFNVFKAGFTHVGLREIKAVLDNYKMDYSRKTIIQASKLEQKLETFEIERDKHTFVSNVAKNMHPLVKFGQMPNQKSSTLFSIFCP